MAAAREGVGGGQENLASFLLVGVGQLGDAGGLSHAVHAYDEDDVGWLWGGRWLIVCAFAGGVQQGDEFFLEGGEDLFRLLEGVPAGTPSQVFDKVKGGFYANVT